MTIYWKWWIYYLPLHKTDYNIKGETPKCLQNCPFHMNCGFCNLYLFCQINIKVIKVNHSVCVSVSHLSPAHCAPSAHGSWSTWSHLSCRCEPRGCWGRGRSLEHKNTFQHNVHQHKVWCRWVKLKNGKFISVRTKYSVIDWRSLWRADQWSGTYCWTADYVHEKREN